MGKIVQLTTPIGNLGDITKRVESALIDGKLFIAEDTRVLRSLMSGLGISTEGKSITSFHDHTHVEKIKGYLEKNRDETIYLSSDAGSPYISDPAFELINLALEMDFEVDTYPGVSSVTTALELSGLAPIPFHFHGFLPRDKSRINQWLESISTQNGTHLFFEGASRVVTTLKLMSQALPDSQMVVARELTKKFQEVLRFKGSEVEDVVDNLTLKGEFVLLISIDEANTQLSSSKLVEMANDLINNGVHPKSLAKLLSEITGEKTKSIYQKLNQ
jgi:16S rRNA (cytidine1402-2'-O)-methyltransferase